MSGVEGHGIARLGVEVEGRREGTMSFTNKVDAARFVLLVLVLLRALAEGKGKASGVVSMRGRDERDVLDLEAWGSWGTRYGDRGGWGTVVWLARRAGCTSVEREGTRVGCVVSSWRVVVDAEGGQRLVCDEFLKAAPCIFGEDDLEDDLLARAECACACGGRGGSGRSCGGGGLRATLFFDASHSGSGALGSSESSVPGTWFLELPRSGIVSVRGFSCSLRIVSQTSSTDAPIVISCDRTVVTDS